MKKYLWFLLLLFVSSCHNEESSPIQEEPVIIDPYHYKSGIIMSGEPLAEALIRSDIDNVQAYRLVNELNKVFDLRKSHPADSFFVKIDSLNTIQELVYIPDKINTYRVLRDSLGLYNAFVDTLKTVKQINICEGEIEYSLWNAIVERQKEGPALAMMLSQIFQWDIDFNIDPKKGDKFKIVYEQYNNEFGKFVKYGSILCARYASQSYDKTAYRYSVKGVGTKYFDEKGKSFQKAFLRTPLNFTRITSKFGTRVHPITKKRRFHNGVDFAAPYGTPVESVADGTVIHASWKGGHPTVNGRKGGYGKTVIIRHTNGYKTLYGHLSSYGKFKVGSRVKQHDVIGYVGSTGLSTGNHLHYTVYHHGKAINPLKIKNVSGPPIPKSEKSKFEEKVSEYKLILQKEVEKFYVPFDEYMQMLEKDRQNQSKS